MSAQPHHWLTPEEYLEFERAAEIRHEYYNGRIYVMPGGSLRHAFIIANLAGRTAFGVEKTALQRGRQRSMFTCCRGWALHVSGHLCPHLRRTEVYSRTDRHRAKPDLDNRGSFAVHRTDRSRVREPREYKKIESLREYALVSQTEARLEVYRRQDGGQWLLSEVAGLEAEARFDSVETSVPLAENLR